MEVVEEIVVVEEKMSRRAGRGKKMNGSDASDRSDCSE